MNKVFDFSFKNRRIGNNFKLSYKIDKEGWKWSAEIWSKNCPEVGDFIMLGLNPKETIPSIIEEVMPNEFHKNRYYAQLNIKGALKKYEERGI